VYSSNILGKQQRSTQFT